MKFDDIFKFGELGWELNLDCWIRSGSAPDLSFFTNLDYKPKLWFDVLFSHLLKKYDLKSVFSFCDKLKVNCIRWHLVHLKELVELYIHLSVRKRFLFFIGQKFLHNFLYIGHISIYVTTFVLRFSLNEKWKSFADA